MERSQRIFGDTHIITPSFSEDIGYTIQLLTGHDTRHGLVMASLRFLLLAQRSTCKRERVFTESCDQNESN